MGRRSHTKSRAGCTKCKTRRVKCDERQPVCLNCSRHGVSGECDIVRTVNIAVERNKEREEKLKRLEGEGCGRESKRNKVDVERIVTLTTTTPAPASPQTEPEAHRTEVQGKEDNRPPGVYFSPPQEVEANRALAEWAAGTSHPSRPPTVQSSRDASLDSTQPRVSVPGADKDAAPVRVEWTGASGNKFTYDEPSSTVPPNPSVLDIHGSRPPTPVSDDNLAKQWFSPTPARWDHTSTFTAQSARKVVGTPPSMIFDQNDRETVYEDNSTGMSKYSASTISISRPPSPKALRELESPFPTPGLPNPYACIDHMFDMRLMHHYTTSTCETMSDSYTTYLWRSEVPKLAFQVPYLMHTLLAIASSHMEALTPESSREEMRNIKLYHHTNALSTFRQAISGGIGPGNAAPVLLASVGLGVYSCSQAHEDTSPGATEWMKLLRGCRDVMSVLHAEGLMPPRTWKALVGTLQEAALEAPMFSYDLPSSLCALTSPSHPFHEESKPALDNLAILRRPHRVNLSEILSWPAHLSQGFMEALERGDEEGMKVLVEYYACLQEVAGFWWVEPIKKRAREIREKAGWLREGMELERRRPEGPVRRGMSASPGASLKEVTEWS